MDDHNAETRVPPPSPPADHTPANRRALRYGCQLPGYVDILTPELTFSPKNIHVIAEDFSRTGCRLISKQIPRDYYRIIIQEVRHVKMEIDLLDGRMLKLRGKLVWIDMQKDQASLGVMFNDLPSENQDALEAVLAELAVKGTIHEVSASRPSIDLSMLELD